MPRPRKCRQIGFKPCHSQFIPDNNSNDQIIISYEEVEALRLCDLMEMEQQEAADSMEVSRGTLQRILNEARKKMSDALVNGKTIRISGGDYIVNPNKRKCGRNRCRQCRFESCEGGIEDSES